MADTAVQEQPKTETAPDSGEAPVAVPAAEKVIAAEPEPAPEVPAKAAEPEAPTKAAEQPAEKAEEKTTGPEEKAAEPTSEQPAVVPTAIAAPDTPAAVAPIAAAATAAPAGASATGASTRSQFSKKLPDILKDVGHDEMWGVKLTSDEDIPTSIVLQKFLNANEGDLTKAIEQLTGALKFRKEKKPLELLDKSFSKAKFGELGAVTVYKVKDGSIPEVFTWNLYGNVKDKMDEVFVPLNDFMDYRIALQELGIRQLNLGAATERITETNDPYKITQVHDYKSISFFRQNPNVRAASTEVIKQFALAYPELLKEKFFVNVPAVMGWMYALIKLFVAAKTTKKFHPMANGANLAAEFKVGRFDWKELPKEYGGEAVAGNRSLQDVPGLVDELKFA